MGDTDENRSVVSTNIIDGLTVMTSNALGGSLYAHMNKQAV